MEEVPPGYIAIGRVGAAWGVRGAFRVLPLADSRALFAPGRGVAVAGKPYTIASAQWRKDTVYLRLSGIEGREAAGELRGRLLAVAETELEPLPEGHYYRFQLIGLTVVSTEGEELGRLADILSTGANDVYVVRGDRGEVLLPATDEVVREIDLEAGRMLIEALPGLLPEPRRKGRKAE
jgi:16S rRNA processing protein RimM